jgi:hypothetical protein
VAPLYHRQLLPMCDDLKVSLSYRVANVVTIHTNTQLRIGAQGYNRNATAAALGLNYHSPSDSPTPVGADVDALNVTGVWDSVTFTLADMFTDIPDVDYLRLQIAIAVAGADDFEFGLGRVRPVRL